MKKILGYIVAVVGLVIVASGTNLFGTAIIKFLPFLSGINSWTLIIIGLAVVLVGIFFLLGGGEKKMKEVPIYHGKDIVGYRRH